MERFYRRQRKNGNDVPAEKPPAEEHPQKPVETGPLPSAPPPAAPGDPPARSPAPASTVPVTEGTVTIDVVGLERQMTGSGKEIVKVRGGQWGKWGATCWEEVYPSLGQWTDIAKMVVGQNYPAGQLGLQAVVEVEDGKPKRVLSFHKK